MTEKHPLLLETTVAWAKTEVWKRLHAMMDISYPGPPHTLISQTMIYTTQQTQQLADEMVEREEKETGKELSEEEKERLWNLVKSSVEGG